MMIQVFKDDSHPALNYIPQWLETMHWYLRMLAAKNTNMGGKQASTIVIKNSSIERCLEKALTNLDIPCHRLVIKKVFPSTFNTIYNHVNPVIIPVENLEIEFISLDWQVKIQESLYFHFRAVDSFAYHVRRSVKVKGFL